MIDIKLKIQTEDFDINENYQWLSNNDQDGAIVIFSGKVRIQDAGKDITALSLEHYPAMTEKVLHNLINEATQRWPIHQVCLIHRVGKLLPGDNIVFVGVSSPHRKAAFESVEFLMDFLKTKAPFWKKEYTEYQEYWVEAKQSDHQATKRW